MSELGKALTELNDPPVKAIVVYNSNPAAIAPNQSLVLQGFRRRDLFKVVLEQFQNDTADYADILLPATTFLEHTDFYFAYGHYYMQMAQAALPAPGEAKSNVEVFRLLAQRMGFDDACFQESEEDMIRATLQTDSKFLQGITLERLKNEHFVKLNVGEPCLLMAEGMTELTADDLDYVPPVESRLGDEALRARYPLELVSSKNDDSMNSTFGNRAAVDAQTAKLILHPADASARGLHSGDAVKVYNDRGSCLLIASVEDGVRPGVVRAPSVRWNKRSPGGNGINVLTSDRLTDIGGGPTFYNCLVQVEKCGD
jgi:anaerobic selenocysteine-containing dehydrogenase